MIGTFEKTPARIRREVGSRLRARREELSLKRSHMADAAGYRNLSKGSQRIAELESGTFVPLPDEDGYCAALRIEPTELRHSLARAAQIEERIERLGQDVVAAERALLGAHAELLRKKSAHLEAVPELASVQSPAVTLRIPWLGGLAVSLGALAAAWAAGSLVAETDQGSVYLFEGAGSPFSGAGLCTGVDSVGAFRQVRRSPTNFLSSGLVTRLREAPVVSPLCLADAIALLGKRVPTIALHVLDSEARPDASPIAVYDPNTRQLHTGTGGAPIVDESTPQDHRVRGAYDGVSTNARRSGPVQLSPGRHLGAFREEDLKHATGLTLSSGSVRGADGWLPVKVVGPCPPPGVLPHLSSLLEGLVSLGRPH